MAEFTTIFLPVESSFAPSEEAATQGKSLLEDACPDYAVTMHRYSAPALITSGSDFEKFRCPSCKKLVKLYELDEEGKRWWYTVLWGLRAEDQIITVPCCGEALTVGQFDFSRDAAFATFTLSVEGLSEDEPISYEQLDSLEAVLGTRVRQIIQVDG
jgi:hypothetical protein